MLRQRLRHGRFNGNEFWNKKIGKIQDLTHQKSKAKLQAAAARRAGVNPYPEFKARLGGVGAELGAGLRGTEFCLRWWNRKIGVSLAGETSDLVGDAKAKRWCDFTKSARNADLIVVAAAADKFAVTRNGSACWQSSLLSVSMCFPETSGNYRYPIN